MSAPSQSLSADAWRRLRRNPVALGAGCLLVLVVAACIAGPWLISQDPSEQRPWLGAQPPGARPVDAWQENRILPGRALEAPPAARRASELRIRYRVQDGTDYAVTLRRGSMSMIQRVTGGAVLPSLVIEEGSIHLVAGDGSLGPDLGPLSLSPGDSVPESLSQAGRRFTLRHLRGDGEAMAIAHLDAGMVLSVHSADDSGDPLPGLTLNGNDILGWWADGRELRQWYPLGTDQAGRDLFARILYGGRISLMVGVVATLVSVFIGVLYGLIAGYVGGRTDRLMMATVDILYAIPFLFLVILLLVSFQRSLLMLFIALGAVQWLTMARIIRGQALSLRQREFIEAAQVLGASHPTIILRHLLPNCMGTVIVYATLTVPLVILQESFLAFIGLQVEMGDGRALDSWGALVQQGMSNLDTRGGDRWWLLIFPSLAMALTLLALNVLGDGLRDCIDPRLRGKVRGAQA